MTPPQTSSNLQSDSFRHHTILVIDQTPSSAHHYQRLLEDHAGTPYQVLTETYDGSIAAVCCSQPVDGIVLVFHHPGSRGFELLEQFADQMEEQCPPIIVVGDDKAEIAVRSLKAGAVDYLVQNQITADTLRQAVESTFGVALPSIQSSPNPATDLSTTNLLTQSADLLQVMIENLPGGAVFVVDRDLRYQLAEGEALYTAGFKPEDLVGRTIFEVMPPELAINYESKYRQALAGEPFEHEHQAHDRFYSSCGTPLRSDNDEVYAVLVVSYDISDRKQVEAALRKSEQQFRSFVTASSDIVYRMSANWQELYQLEGKDFLASTEYPNQSWIETYIPLAEQPRVWAAAQDAIRTRSLFELEHQVIRQDGTIGWTFSRAIPLLNEQGEIVEWLGAASDVTDHKRAEAALRESEQRLSAIFAQAAVGLSEISLDGYFQRVNQSLCQLLGRSRDGLLIASVADVTHPDDRSKSLAALAHLRETGGSVSIDKRYVRPDGTTVWANSILTRLDDQQGRAERFLVVTIDLSDRKQAEANQICLIQEQAAHQEEQQRAESLAELNRAKTLFFNNVSHEFRTPLTLLLGPLEDAIADLEAWESRRAGASPSPHSTNPSTHSPSYPPTHPPPYPSPLQPLHLAHRNALRLLKLVNTLLDFSRVEAERVQVNYEPTDLATYTADLASMFRSTIESAGLQFTVDCPSLPESVYIDREMWEKIVLNLLSNAFKFTFEGEIRVSLRVGEWESAQVSEHSSTHRPIDPPTHPHFILTIRDTGKGIPPDELPHIFERFYQSKSSQGRSYEGSGIGLALVQELVKLQGGTVNVTSEIGQGTTFTVRVPTSIEHLPADARFSARWQSQMHLSARSSHKTSTPQANAFVQEAQSWQRDFELPIGGFGFQDASESAQEPSDSEPQPNHPKSIDERSETSRRVSQNPKSRILLVEDNADMRVYLRRLLVPYYQVDTAADGSAALATIQDALDRDGEGGPVYDLVLTDIMMPGLNGFELLRSLRENPDTQEIPTILLSARAGEEAQIEGLEAGADDYLVKPFSARQLLARVDAHLKLAQMRRQVVYQQQITREVQALNDTLEQRVQARTAQLEAINQELDAFSYSVSHDLQTPLRYINSFVERLRTQLTADQADASSLRYLKIIETAAGQAHKMINDLLQFSRMGKTPLNMARVAMNELVEQVRSHLEPETIDRSIDWQIEPLPEVEGDPDLLRLVVQNLLSNAVKYTRDRAIATITIGSNAYDHEIIFFVQDNGAGFDMKYQDRLFSLFQRLHSQEQFAGTGVGLANVRRIIHRHSGRVWAEGAVDQGATFYFSLPKQEVIE